MHRPGLVNATDLDGGSAAWAAASLPIAARTRPRRTPRTPPGQMTERWRQRTLTAAPRPPTPARPPEGPIAIRATWQHAYHPDPHDAWRRMPTALGRAERRKRAPRPTAGPTTQRGQPHWVAVFLPNILLLSSGLRPVSWSAELPIMSGGSRSADAAQHGYRHYRFESTASLYQDEPCRVAIRRARMRWRASRAARRQGQWLR